MTFFYSHFPISQSLRFSRRRLISYVILIAYQIKGGTSL